MWSRFADRLQTAPFKFRICVQSEAGKTFTVVFPVRIGFKKILFILFQSFFRIPTDIWRIGLSGTSRGELKHDILERFQLPPCILRRHCGDFFHGRGKMTLNRGKMRSNQFPFQQVLTELNSRNKIFCFTGRFGKQQRGCRKK